MEDLRAVHAALKKFALSLPGAHEDHPWGETVVKVDKKVFVFLGHDDPDDDSIGFGVKLPISGPAVLERPYAQPSGYGLGKSGWVNIHFFPGERPPVDEFKAWIEESYRAVALKKRIKELDASR